MDQDDDIYRTIIAPFFEILIRIKNRYTIFDYKYGNKFQFSFYSLFSYIHCLSTTRDIRIGVFRRKGKKEKKKAKLDPNFSLSSSILERIKSFPSRCTHQVSRVG